MKKKIILMPCIVAVAFATFVGKNTFESHANETVDLLMQNLEALSNDEDDWSDCPRDKYIRNAKESWCEHTVQYDAGFGFYIKVKGEKIKLGAGAKVGATIFVPDCPDSPGNCCEKTHLNKGNRYP